MSTIKDLSQHSKMCEERRKEPYAYLASHAWFSKPITPLFLPGAKNSFMVEIDLPELFKQEEEGGIFLYDLPRIIRWFGGTIFKSERLIRASLYPLSENLPNHRIISMAKDSYFYKELDLFSAFRIIELLYYLGELEKIPGVVIYIKEKHNGYDCRVSVNRCSEKKFGIDVDQILYSGQWYAGYRVLGEIDFKNDVRFF